MKFEYIPFIPVLIRTASVTCVSFLWMMLSYTLVSAQSPDTTDTSSQTTRPCLACSATPPELVVRHTFVQQMLWTTSNARTTAQGWGGVGLSLAWWFQWGLFNTGEPTVIKGLLRTLSDNIAQKAQTLWATAFLVTTISSQLIAKDGPLGFAVLFQWRSVLRDFVMIQDLDSQLSNEILDLGIAGMYTKTVPPEVLQQYNALIQEYKGWQIPLRSPNSTLSAWVTYDKVLTMLRRLNGRYKTFVSTDNSNPFTVSRTYERNNGQILIAFASGYDQLLENAYQCTRGVVNQCSTALKNFGESIKKIWSDTKDQAKESLNTIKESRKRLKVTLWFRDSQYIDEQLREFNGYKQFATWRSLKNMIPRVNVDIPNPLSSADKKILHVVDNKVQTDRVAKQELDLKQSQRDAARAQRDQEQNQKKSDNAIQPVDGSFDVRDPSIVARSSNEAFAQAMAKTMLSIANQQEQDATRALIADPRYTTIQIWSVIQSVQSSNNAIWSKDTPWSIVSSLWQSCELQCANKGGTCWY